MENNKLISVETIIKEGKLYIKCSYLKDGLMKELERSYYDENGNVDPKVSELLELARNLDETALTDNSEYSMNGKELVEPVSNVKDLVVYNNPNENAKVKRNYKGMIASGLAGLLLGLTIMGLVKGCSKDKNASDNANKTEITDQINENADLMAEEDKITYMTEEEYLNGSQELCNYLNTLGFDYKLTDVNSFYYSANMDMISEELFTKLVSEGYIPATDTAILQDTLGITSDIKTKAGQTGNMNIDYTKVFADKEMASISEEFKNKHNKIASATNEETKTIVNDLEDYIIVTPERGYNTLPVGGRFVFNTVIADSIGIQSYKKNVKPSQALEDEIKDITAYVMGLKHNLDCVAINDAEKQLVK